VLDRLDVAFADSEGLERNALRALFRVYRDMQGLNNVSVKILLRDDIWARITDEGFREASHITRAVTYPPFCVLSQKGWAELGLYSQLVRVTH
jgi:hypothetical protein